MTQINPDIRWKQRFENFQNAYLLMAELLAQPTLNRTERTALIKYFEMTFELSWKLMKDYLELNGLDPKSPRDVIKMGLTMGLIEDGYGWLDALEKRNVMTHTYNESTSNAVVALISSQYGPLITQLWAYFKSKL